MSYVQGTITSTQVFFLQRVSYINVLFIQSRRVVRNPPCNKCTERMYSFLEYRRVSEHFRKCCRNYKWPDYDVRCTANNDDDNDDSDSSIEFTDDRVI